MVTCVAPWCAFEPIEKGLCMSHLQKNWKSPVRSRALLKGELCVECEAQTTREAVIVDDDGDALCKVCWEQLNQRSVRRSHG